MSGVPSTVIGVNWSLLGLRGFDNSFTELPYVSSKFCLFQTTSGETGVETPVRGADHSPFPGGGGARVLGREEGLRKDVGGPEENWDPRGECKSTVFHFNLQQKVLQLFLVEKGLWFFYPLDIMALKKRILRRLFHKVPTVTVELSRKLHRGIRARGVGTGDLPLWGVGRGWRGREVW